MSSFSEFLNAVLPENTWDLYSHSIAASEPQLDPYLSNGIDQDFDFAGHENPSLVSLGAELILAVTEPQQVEVPQQREEQQTFCPLQGYQQVTTAEYPAKPQEVPKPATTCQATPAPAPAPATTVVPRASEARLTGVTKTRAKRNTTAKAAPKGKIAVLQQYLQADGTPAVAERNVNENTYKAIQQFSETSKKLKNPKKPGAQKGHKLVAYEQKQRCRVCNEQRKEGCSCEGGF